MSGTEPVYSHKIDGDGKFQARVNLSLPLDSRKITSTYIDVIGAKCPTMFEAESEASAAALQVLQHGCLRIRVKDVSRTRCKDLEGTCQQVLGHACQVYHRVKSLITSWESTMDKAEKWYSPDRLKGTGSTQHGQQRTTQDVIFIIRDLLANLTRENYLRLKELDFKTEKAKTRIEKVQERVKEFFAEASFCQGNGHRGDLPEELELSMKLILQEMMISIGWDNPKFDIISSGMSVHACKTTLSPHHLYSGPATKALSITGLDAPSKEEAIENSCKAAISLLESEKSICLVDLNYNHRSHGEHYVVEAKETLESTYVIGSSVLSEWESMIDCINRLKESYGDVAMDHPEAEHANCINRIRSTSMKSLSELHRDCFSDLQSAKCQFNNKGV